MSFKKGETFPCNPQTVRGRYTKLSTNKEGTKVVYVNDKTVVIRDIDDPKASVGYTQHVQPATVARISPSGFYCASADITGQVRIWDISPGSTDNALKSEIRAISGKINDLAWDSESKRIIVGGEGKEGFGKAFFVDGGASCGTVEGHNKTVNAVTIKSSRPFRAVTASDDGNLCFYTGVPFKYTKNLAKSHNGFINDVQYAPSGEILAACGSDSTISLYEGKEGESLGKLEGHKGTVYGIAWSPDSKLLASASADGSVKLWDVAERKCTNTFELGTGVDGQQLGVCFTHGGATVTSISLDGWLNVWDPKASGQVRRIPGPTKAVTSGIALPGKDIYVGSFDGGVKKIDIESKAGWEDVPSSTHGGRVVGLTEAAGGVASIGWDDAVKFQTKTTKTLSQPTSIAALGSTIFTTTSQSLEIVQDGKLLSEVTFNKAWGTPLSVAAAGKFIAIGFENKQVQLSTFESDKLSEPLVVFEDSKGSVYSLAFSPDEELLAAGDSAGKIQVFSVAEKKIKISGRWASHTGRITSLSFSANSKYCVSSSLDTHVYVWSIEKPLKSIAIRNANAGGAAFAGWVGETKVVSAGNDGCLRVWDLTLVV